MTKEAFLKKLGSNIARLRDDSGLSQVEMAQRMGSSKQSINRIEKGGHNPSAYILQQMATILKVPVKDFFDFE